MRRIMIVPAAGAGTRLGSNLPKLLVRVAGKLMIDHLIERYTPFVEQFVLVVSPAAEPAVRAHFSLDPRVVLDCQESPTGMLDAILLPTERIRKQGADEIWITWCDQVAIRPETADRLARVMADAPAPDLALPTAIQPDPYIHFDRDERGRIHSVRQSREGDEMPLHGEGDSGLFALSRRACLEWLPEFAQSASIGAMTGERNFLPFIPWVADRAEVSTFAVAHIMEATGINTPAELKRIEAFLHEQDTQHRHPGL